MSDPIYPKAKYITGTETPGRMPTDEEILASEEYARSARRAASLDTDSED